MNKQRIKIFYSDYFQLANRDIKISLKNGNCFTATIAAFYYRNNEIYKWRITLNTSPTKAVLLNNQLYNETIILVKDIASILLLHNQKSITF